MSRQIIVRNESHLKCHWKWYVNFNVNIVLCFHVSSYMDLNVNLNLNVKFLGDLRPKPNYFTINLEVMSNYIQIECEDAYILYLYA